MDKTSRRCFMIIALLSLLIFFISNRGYAQPSATPSLEQLKARYEAVLAQKEALARESERYEALIKTKSQESNITQQICQAVRAICESIQAINAIYEAKSHSYPSADQQEITNCQKYYTPQKNFYDLYGLFVVCRGLQIDMVRKEVKDWDIIYASLPLSGPAIWIPAFTPAMSSSTEELKQQLEEFKRLESAFSEKFKEYQKLKHREQRGERGVNEEIVSVLGEMVTILRKLEGFYSRSSFRNPDESPERQQIQKYIETFTRELTARRG